MESTSSSSPIDPPTDSSTPQPLRSVQAEPATSPNMDKQDANNDLCQGFQNLNLSQVPPTVDSDNRKEPMKPPLETIPSELMKSISRHLSERDIITCWRVSRRLRAFFTDPDGLRTHLLTKYSHARAVRNLSDHEQSEGKKIDTNDQHICERLQRLFWEVTANYEHLSALDHVHYTRFLVPKNLNQGEQMLWQARSRFRLDRFHFVRAIRVNFNHEGLYLYLDWHGLNGQTPVFSYDKGLLLWCDRRGRLLFCNLDNDNGNGISQMIDFHQGGCCISSFRIKNSMILIEWMPDPMVHATPGFSLSASFYKVTGCTSVSSIPLQRHMALRLPVGIFHTQADKRVWFSSHTNETYAIYVWEKMRDNTTHESLTIWDISSQASGPILLSQRHNNALRDLGVLQGPYPRLRFFCHDGNDRDKVFFVEQRSNLLFGDDVGDMTDATSSFEERVVGVPIAYQSSSIIESWYDASGRYGAPKNESWIRCMGSRTEVDDWSVTETYMLDRDARISMSICRQRRGQDFELNVLGKARRFLYTNGTHWTISNIYHQGNEVFQGDESWLIGTVNHGIPVFPEGYEIFAYSFRKPSWLHVGAPQ
ncbi:MAG: hypothetical protein Q9184_005539 [Pyrenodesmia sp. 2 TL-2023]